jgi:ubiquinone/menaquinone biosynthesis C-methylase UbiE/DNA-binding transcriptional ArsR family regulator
MASSVELPPADILQSVSDPVRLRLLRLLVREELNVQEMVRILGMSQPRISKHLAILRDGRWIRQRREGTWSWYRAVPAEEQPQDGDLLRGVLALADRLDEAAQDDRGLAQALVEREARTRAFFAGAAEHWDELRRGFEHPDLKAAALAALVDDRLSVVDIGTGTGALLPLLAGVGAQVAAVDLSAEMLAKARLFCARAGLRGVHFERADVQALPFPAEAFDAAFCAMALHHVSRPAAAMREMARVVRSRGRVVVIGFVRHNLTWVRQKLAHQWLGFAREEIEDLFRGAGLRPHGYLVSRQSHARGERPEGGRGRQAVGWPDLFLASAIKDAAAE